VHGELFLNENHDDVAIAIGHCQVHRCVAELVRDGNIDTLLDEIADERSRSADDGKHEGAVATAGRFVDCSTVRYQSFGSLQLAAQASSVQGGEAVMVGSAAQIDFKALLNVPE
jgi:hypothetical protein